MIASLAHELEVFLVEGVAMQCANLRSMIKTVQPVLSSGGPDEARLAAIRIDSMLEILEGSADRLRRELFPEHPEQGNARKIQDAGISAVLQRLAS